MNRNALKEAAFKRVAERMVRQLSDSLTARKSEIEDLMTILPGNHPSLPKLRGMLCRLNEHELAQMEFSLSTDTKETNP